MNVKQSKAKRCSSGTRKATSAYPLTIYDGDKYFDAKFSEEERRDISRQIAAVYGCDEFMGVYFLWDRTNRELCRELDDWNIPEDWAYIHICRQLEIDYKAFAKNVPKLPVEPFYRFVESRFRDFKPAKNKLQMEIQTKQIARAFTTWIKAQCEEAGCTEPYHDYVCQDRYQKPDYETAARRIWEHNASHPKLTLVHSA